MNESDEPEEVRGAGYAAVPVRRRVSDYSDSEHLAMRRTGSRTSVLKRMGHRLVVAWKTLRRRPDVKALGSNIKRRKTRKHE